MQKNRLLIGSGVALALLLVSAVWFCHFYPDTAWSKLARVQKGMTVDEVQAILGRPAHEETWPRSPPDPPNCPCYQVWDCGGRTIIVDYDRQGRVKAKLLGLKADHYTRLDLVLYWIGW
jgi:hypothetical protein